MFDVGFSEMLVIGIVALVVIGPERLPKVARTLGVLFGRLQRYVAQVKSDIGREMEMADLDKMKTEFQDAARSFKTSVESKGAEVEREIRDAQAAIERDLDAQKPPAPTLEPDMAFTPPSHEPAADAALPAPSASDTPPSPQLELGIEPPPPTAPRDRAPG
jgi:sec-independent protein translocase protein TatB